MLAVIFAVSFALIWGFAAVGLALPRWLETPLIFATIYFSFEVASRIGPKAFDTQLDKLVGEHKHFRNKVAVLLFFLVPFSLLEYQRDQQNVHSFWHGLFYFAVGWLLSYLLALIAATPAFRNSLLPKPLRSKS